MQKPLPPLLQGAGALRVDAAMAPVEELVLVTVASIPKEESGLAEQIASMGPQLEKLPISILSPDPLPATNIEPAEESTDASEQVPPEAGDPAVRALMFGRYMGQISARIERAWLRPRSPVNESVRVTGNAGADGDAASADEIFSCQAQIRQDARGNVQEVLLLQCNGSEAWRHSLVLAINQSSPLPAPPTPTVFTREVTMNFEAHSYQPESAASLYEREPRCGVQNLADSRSAHETMHTVEESTAADSRTAAAR